jgi:hypothetical protein
MPNIKTHMWDVQIFDYNDNKKKKKKKMDKSLNLSSYIKSDARKN